MEGRWCIQVFHYRPRPCQCAGAITSIMDNITDEMGLGCSVLIGHTYRECGYE